MMIARPDDDLGGGDHHHEEREDDAVEVAPHVGEGDQRQVDRVEHQLDAHEHHDGVAAHQEADRADAEQQRGQHQVVVRASSVAPRVDAASPATSAGADSSSGRRGCSALSISVSVPPLRNRRATRSLSENSTRSDTDPGAIEPSGSSAGVALDDEVANTPGAGQRRHPVGAHPLVHPLPLGLALAGRLLDVRRAPSRRWPR